MRSMMSCRMVRWQWLIASDAVDQAVDFAFSEPIERERSDMRLSDPRRLELRPDRLRSATRQAT